MSTQLFRRSMVIAAALVVFQGEQAMAQAGKPVTFGINVSLTGVFAESIKPTMNADQLWEKEVNARGGLLGRKVAMTFLDNKSNPETAVAIYERLLQDNHDFIFENGGSLVVQRESTLAEQRQKLFLVPNGFARALYLRGYKYIFYTGAAVSEDLNIGLIKLIQALPADQRPKSIGYVTVENIAFTSTTKGVQELVKPLNLETRLDITYPPNIADVTPLITNLKQRSPDIVFQTGLVNDTFLFARAIAQQDLRSKMIVIGITAGAQPNFLPAVGKVSEGMIYSTAWEPRLRTKGNAEFVRAYTQAYVVPPIYNAAQAYARWQILEDSVRATKSLDQKVLRDHIAKSRFDTVVGPIDYKDKGYSVPADTVVTQFQNGERVIVWPPDQATGKFIYPRP